MKHKSAFFDRTLLLSQPHFYMLEEGEQYTFSFWFRDRMLLFAPMFIAVVFFILLFNYLGAK